jgi:hypothetical protein
MLRFAAVLAGACMAATAAMANPTVANFTQPGSLIVYPYFQTGTVLADGTTLPKTEIHITPVCPSGITCTGFEPVIMVARWVCPASRATGPVCPSTDFLLQTTVNGTITLNPNGQATINGALVSIPVPDCPRGYLMAYVVNSSELPIKFDGLEGDAIVHTFPTAEASYSGLAIQAADTNPADVGELITTGTDTFTGQTSFLLDGLGSDYAVLTGQLSDSILFDNAIGPGVFDHTDIVLLTLDVQLNRPNNPTFVDFTFYNAAQQPTSDYTYFTCWNALDITRMNAGLTQQAQGSPEGSFVTGQAEKFAALADTHGPVTLLGLVLSFQGGTKAASERESITQPSNNGVQVPNDFLGLD